MLSDELRYQLLRTLERNPEMTQRQMARELGLSLGKVNYCLKALLDKGWIKAGNFKKNPNKIGYAYILTPGGIEEKANATVRFLKRKLEEHEKVQREIEQLRSEVSNNLGP
ncbi:MarR family EPS-associated transcriptional regulator [Saccharospirillum sp.]|uniref:MarR family EPS-associated transcriptional regulator n=1 Tax=Saccharospirillum sp. TaxID=2033801 RepID=UPI0034A0A3CE